MTEGVKGDDFIDRDILKTYGAQAIKRTMMAARTGRMVIVEPGVSLVGRVWLSVYKVGFSIGVGLEGCGKIQNK